MADGRHLKLKAVHS